VSHPTEAERQASRERNRRYYERHKERLRAANREYYHSNKEKFTETRAKNRRKKAEWYADLKRNKPCVDCKQSFHPAAMDWHHINGDGISSKTAMTRLGKKRLEEELNKCILLCSNCHRIRTWAKL